MSTPPADTPEYEIIAGSYGEYTTIPAGMTDPVRCYCGQVYDLDTVHVTAHHADCSVWRAPCCGRESDNRPWDGGGNGYTTVRRPAADSTQKADVR